MSILIGIVGFIGITIPLGMLIGQRIKVISRDYASHNGAPVDR